MIDISLDFIKVFQKIFWTWAAFSTIYFFYQTKAAYCAMSFYFFYLKFIHQLMHVKQTIQTNKY